MTDDELERMRTYAEAAREHPTWSVAYAQDVPKLLAVVADQRAALKITEGWQVNHRLNGEPVTEPVAPASDPGVKSGD